MLGRFSICALALAGALAVGCGSRSPVTADVGGHGGAITSSPTTSAGGSAPIDCPALAVTAPADVDTGGALAARPALIFGSNNGRVVSVFHARTEDPSAGSALEVTTLTPWESWPPMPGDRFVVDANGGESFAVGDQLHGNVALLAWHTDPEPSENDGLAFSNAISATSPQSILPMQVASTDADPAAIALVRGHDAPPVAFNAGYMAMLVMWDAIDAASGAHALKLGVDNGSNVFTGLTTRPDDPDLACADDRVAAAAVRAGSKWLVLAATSTDLLPCGEAGPVGPPSTLAVDRVDWGAPDAVDWTLTRAGEKQGADPIERIRMIPMIEGGLALVQRGGHADLVRVDGEGSMHDAGALAPVDGDRILFSEIVALSQSVLLAHVDVGAPDRVHLEVRDGDGVTRASTVIDVGDTIESLTTLGAKDGSAALLGWATSGGRVQLARASCAEGT